VKLLCFLREELFSSNTNALVHISQLFIWLATLSLLHNRIIAEWQTATHMMTATKLTRGTEGASTNFTWPISSPLQIYDMMCTTTNYPEVWETDHCSCSITLAASCAQNREKQKLTHFRAWSANQVSVQLSLLIFIIQIYAYKSQIHQKRGSK
jgi:hypothetical protein